MKNLIIILAVFGLTISSCKKDEFVNDAYINFDAYSEEIIDSLSIPYNANKSYVEIELLQKNGFQNKSDLTRNFDLLKEVSSVGFYYSLQDKETIGVFDPTKEINATVRVFGKVNSEVKLGFGDINYEIETSWRDLPALISTDSINGTEYNFVIKFKE